MKTYSVFVILIISITAFHAEARTNWSDHRVENLSCKNVTANSVAQAIRPVVYDVSNHLPYQNWSFHWGLYDLANCWSLSRFQRLYFMMREPNAGLGLTEFSNQVRSEDMYEDDHGWKGFPLKSFWFLPDQADARWRTWENGWTETGSSPRSLARGLKADIEYYQVLRFHQIDNLRYLKGPIARTVADNQATWSDLSSSIANGRKPLLLLRPDPYYQHVVVAKRIETTATGANIWVYDSNAPSLERPVVWIKSTSMFTAFEIVDGFPVPDARAPLGVFVVDRDENEKMLESLATHYQQVCAKP
ncbi:hypothetical protein BH10BDE1_BH10BDE1_10770 [soil metagenome]